MYSIPSELYVSSSSTMWGCFSMWQMVASRFRSAENWRENECHASCMHACMYTHTRAPASTLLICTYTSCLIPRRTESTKLLYSLSGAEVYIFYGWICHLLLWDEPAKLKAQCIHYLIKIAPEAAHGEICKWALGNLHLEAFWLLFSLAQINSSSWESW